LAISTIIDVAKLAEVSITTVSRVINNEPSVRTRTREKVLEAIKTLNFKPNLSARNLSGSKSYLIGYIYDTPNTYYITGMQNGILNACRDQGYGLLIHPYHNKPEDIIEELKTLIHQSRLSGLILTPPFSENSDITDALDEMSVEFVAIVSGHTPDEEQNNRLVIDDQKAAFEITEHLIDLDHEHIAFFAGDEDHASTQERVAGYKEALKKHHITPNPDLILSGEYSYDSGKNRALQLLASPAKVTAIIGCNDEIAAGAQHGARLLHIAMPNELSIVGFEDNPYSRQAHPMLTTAQQSHQKIAEVATNMLINQIRPQKTAPKKTHDNRVVTREVDTFSHNFFTPTLIIRESTAKASK
jgi:LacI family transcriptional regulator